MLLNSTTRKIQALLSGAAATTNPVVLTDWADRGSSGASWTAGCTPSDLDGTTAVDIVAAPSSGFSRKVFSVSVLNVDTAAVTVTVRYDDDSTTYNIITATLAIGDMLSFADGSGWRVTDSTGSLKQSAQLTLASGTYTPTLANVANLAASTAYQCQYLRVGSTVTVSGKVDVDPTLAATSTQLGISLPIASNLGAAEDCAGAAFSSAIAGQGAAILGDATNNRAQMQWLSGDITNQAMYFTFTYEII